MKLYVLIEKAKGTQRNKIGEEIHVQWWREGEREGRLDVQVLQMSYTNMGIA